MSNKQLLIPIKVEALVIEGDVLKEKGNGRHWSPFGPNYNEALRRFNPPGPPPFFDADINDQGVPQLNHDKAAIAIADDTMRGVHLQWILPPSLRHAHRYEKDHVLEYPPLPDRWLICRFARRSDDAGVETKAWVVDSSIVGQPAADSDPRLLVQVQDTKGNYHQTTKTVGEVSTLEDFLEKAEEPRTTVTAVGNASTGSVRFTAAVAENKNMLSFHDNLQDLRPAQNMAEDPVVVSVSYLVLGSYRDAAQEPLKYVPTVLADAPQETQQLTKAVLDALRWQLGPGETQTTPLPEDLLAWRCLFHGQLAHIHFWDKNRYRGPLLGFPGSDTGPGFAKSRPILTVGVGNNAADALIALIAGDVDARQSGENSSLWKALQAVIYHQSYTLLKGWSETPQEFEVHQSWFTPQFGGLQWTIAPEERDAKTMAVQTEVKDTSGQSKTVQSYDPQPTEPQLTALKELNEAQKAANAAARDLAALQQEFYAAWWSLCYAEKNEQGGTDAIRQNLKNFAAQIEDARARQNLQTVQTKKENLESSLHSSGLRLLLQIAPRFYKPTDPVVVIHNVGHQHKHEFPDPLICRQTGDWLDSLHLNTGSGPQTVSAAADISAVKDKLSKPFSDANVAQTMGSLLEEAALIESAAFRLAAGTAMTTYSIEADWENWMDRIHGVLQNASTEDKELAPWINFSGTSADDGLLRRLVRFWEGQPWTPLYMDWLISYSPQNSSGADLLEGWQKEAFDYMSEGRDPAAPYQIQGRSIMNPIDGHFFSQPIQDLKNLLSGKAGEEAAEHGGVFDPRLVKILSEFSSVWEDDLQTLQQGGLLGQTLSGIHEAFLGRDTFLPRFQPNPAIPFAHSDTFSDTLNGQTVSFKDGDLVSADGQGDKYLDPPFLLPGEEAVTLPSMYPPGQTAPKGSDSLPFSLLRGGSMKLEALWVVDDFGQWLDLNMVDNSQHDFVQVKVSPHSRWPGDEKSIIALPPRFVQPARLDFRFVSSDFGQVSGAHPDSHPVCGWVFHNMIDQALTLCAGDGRLLGELALIDEGNNQVSARFVGLLDSDASGSLPRANTVEDLQQIDDTLFQFAKALVYPAPGERHPLQDLLLLIDQALGNIRTGMGNRYQFAGRPLALVNATLGLELFGRAWTKPGNGPPPAGGSGDAELDKVKIPVRLGHEQMKFDGLIGYYQRGAGVPMDKIYPVSPISDPTITAEQLSGYVNNEESEALVDFGQALQLTLLMDPLGLVHADTRLLPGKVLQLPERFLKSASKHLEFSFRVAPTLLRIPTPAAAETVPENEKPVVSMPVPTGMQGKWSFSGPVTQQTEIDAAGPAGKPDFTPWLPLAAEGRLTLRTSNKKENQP